MQQHQAYKPRLSNVGAINVRSAHGVYRVMGLLVTVLLGWSAPSAHAALDPVLPGCASVALNGDVALTWAGPPDPGGDFGEYRIYHATAAAGPFLLLTSIPNYVTTNYVHAGANAGLGPRFYYFTTLTLGPTPQESLPSDTVATIFLQVFQSTPPGSAVLSWNALGVAPSADDTFSVWMEYPIGTWQELAELNTTLFSYQHIVSICEDSLTFRIERADASGCGSRSNVDGDVFRDVTPPTAPELIGVTVDTLTGLATLEWEASPEADTDGYIIVFQAPSGAVIIDTVFGQNTTSYEWLESLAGLGAESYTVAAFDTCETGVPPSPNTSSTRPMHTTVYIEQAYDECTGLVTLEWSPYVGWEVSGYRIFAQVDGGQWTLAGTVVGTVTNFVQAVEPFRTYCFAVEARQDDGVATSWSNRTCLITDYPGLPAFNYLRTVTVSGETEITIVDSLDAAATVVGYILQRSVNGGAYSTIETRGPQAGPTMVFTDRDVSPGTSSYQYRVVVLDGCGNESLISNTGANIVLQTRAELSGIEQLEWNGYQGWAGTTQGHAIYRQVEQMPYALLNIVPAIPWSYTDDVAELTGTTGRFCYYLIAFEVGNPSGINATSQSNMACAVQEELVYIPNAFVIGGANPVFQPVWAYTDVSEYELSIINRWGQVFWTTTDPDRAWDGTAGGKQVPLGVYAYYCNFKNGAGRVFEKRGTVTVLTATE